MSQETPTRTGRQRAGDFVESLIVLVLFVIVVAHFGQYADDLLKGGAKSAQRASEQADEAARAEAARSGRDAARTESTIRASLDPLPGGLLPWAGGAVLLFGIAVALEAASKPRPKEFILRAKGFRLDDSTCDRLARIDDLEPLLAALRTKNFGNYATAEDFLEIVGVSANSRELVEKYEEPILEAAAVSYIESQGHLNES